MEKITLLVLLFGLSLPINADKIAIIGGGASGLVSAFLLEHDHEVTLYESSNRLGGHINTLPIKIDGKEVNIEAGAEFFNETSYPHFLRLLRYFKIPIKTYTLITNFYRTDIKQTLILPPYHDGTIETISLTPSNLYRLLQLKRVIDKGRKIIESHNMSLLFSDFINTVNLEPNFKTDFIFPFIASAWGVTPEDIKTTSAYISLKYLIEGNDAGNYKWYEVEKGLSYYIKIVQSSLKTTKVLLNSPVRQIERENEHYIITTVQGSKSTYDQVILSTNPNIAADLLGKLPDIQDLVATLKSVRYYDTKIAIHSDTRFMPEKKKNWRVVNIAYNGQYAATTIYKKWKTKTPIFRSWITFDVRSPNDTGPALPNNLHALVNYKHPYTDQFYIEAQRMVKQMQGYRNLWFVGVWTRDNDSHESALVSAVKVAEKLAPHSRRLKIMKGEL